MTHQTIGGTRVATRPTTNVPGGMAEISRARTSQLIRGGRPVWADDPDLDLPCQRPEVDPDWWFESGTSFENQARREQAIRLCASCPMQRECAAHAIATPRETWGIWGGHVMERTGR